MKTRSLSLTQPDVLIQYKNYILDIRNPSLEPRTMERYQRRSCQAHQTSWPH